LAFAVMDEDLRGRALLSDERPVWHPRRASWVALGTRTAGRKGRLPRRLGLLAHSR
jgi:hypothetical protein